MAVAIQILSGSRQGERLEFDSPDFRAGDAPTCEIFFNPAHEVGARGRTVLFQLGEDGWLLRSVGASGVIVNDRAIAGHVHLRSGDVVRLSATGPDLSFQLIPRLSARSSAGSAAPINTAPRPVTFPAFAPPVQAVPAMPYPPIHAAQAAMSSANTVTPAAHAETAARATAENPTAPLKAGKSMAGRASLLVAAAALAIAMILLVQQLPDHRGSGKTNAVRQTAQNNDNVTPNGGESRGRMRATDPNADVADGIGNDEHETVGPTNSPSPKPIGNNGVVEPRPPASRDWETIAAQLRDAIWLVTVEEPKSHTAWPIGVAAAVRPHAALSSATVVGELNRFKRQGWKIWLSQPDNGRRLAIDELRLHLGFASSSDDPARQIYDDFGRLTVDEEFNPVFAVADGEERAEIGQGMPLACLSIGFDWEPVTKHQAYEPKLLLGKVRFVTALQPGRPDSPRLVHAALTTPSKAYGSPVLNSSGHIIGVYAETAPQAGDQPDAGSILQYVPVFDRRWLDDDDQWWVPPVQSPKSDVQRPKSSND